MESPNQAAHAGEPLLHEHRKRRGAGQLVEKLWALVQEEHGGGDGRKEVDDDSWREQRGQVRADQVIEGPKNAFNRRKRLF